MIPPSVLQEDVQNCDADPWCARAKPRSQDGLRSRWHGREEKIPEHVVQ